MDMGFARSQCKAALKKHRNNVEVALDQLLENGDQFIGVGDSESDGEESLFQQQIARTIEEDRRRDEEAKQNAN